MNDDEIEEPFKKGNSRNRPGGYSMAVSKLLETLQRAEAEFHAIEDKHSARKFRAAKFLRDTAENTMAYFRTNGLPDQRTMRRIEKSYWLGHQATLTATGGRHRPFEMNQREYSHRTRQLKAGRTNFGRADCYRPGEERRSPTERVGRDTRRL